MLYLHCRWLPPRESAVSKTYCPFVQFFGVKFFLDYVYVRQQHFDNGFRESFHVSIRYLGVGTFQFGYDPETLRKLSEYVHHWIGKQRMFRTFLKLQLYIKQSLKNFPIKV